MHAASDPALAPRAAGVLPAVTRALAPLVEIPTVLAVAAEVVVLFCGVAARYVFHTPLIWSDELASIIGRVSPEVGLRRIWPYLGALMVGIVVIALVPWLSTGLVTKP